MPDNVQSALVLGVGTPNLCLSGDRTMCAIMLGDLGLFRIYPISGEERFRVWSWADLTLERPNTDSRDESYKLLDYDVTGRVDDAGEKRAILDRCVLLSGKIDPLKYQNDIKKSVCVIRPEKLGAEMESQDGRSDDNWVHTQDMSWAKPYVTWTSVQGGFHKSHLVSREAYETIRRNPHSPWDLFRNMNLNSPDWDFWLVLGNLKKRRNVWCTVHVHRLKKTSGLSTPLYCDLISGKADDWPYSMQRTGNAPADNQLLMFTIEDMCGAGSRGNTVTRS